MITAVIFGKLWALILAFIANLENICTVIGSIAIAIPTADGFIHRAQARWPNARFWKWIDKFLFGSGIALVNIGRALDRMLAKKRSIQSGTPMPPDEMVTTTITTTTTPGAPIVSTTTIPTPEAPNS